MPLADWLDTCSDRILMLDGAMGTQLQARGLAGGDCPEQWARRHPVELAEIHSAYVDAGADIILTCTFGGSPLKLAGASLDDETEAINWALARVAREAAPETIILGDIGPSGEMIAPLGTKTADEIRDAFARQVAGLADVVDGFLAETMSDVEFNATFEVDSADWRRHQLDPETSAYDSPQDHWIAALQGRVDLLPTAELALQTMLISEGIYLSDARGCEVTPDEVREASKSTAVKL